MSMRLDIGERETLKGKQLSYDEMKNAEVGTLFVGKDSNNIYEVIKPKTIKNRETGIVSDMAGMAMCEYLGIQPNDILANAEEW